MNPETLLLLLQVGRLALETIERNQRGELTEAQARAEAVRIARRIDDANVLWEQATR